MTSSEVAEVVVSEEDTVANVEDALIAMPVMEARL